MSEPVTRIKTPVRLRYRITAGRQRTRFLTALLEKRILGGRCPETGKVYVPPTGSAPVSGLPTEDLVQVAEVGTVTTFCVINIPFEGQKLAPPYVAACVLLDGSDMPIFHLVGGCDPQTVCMGMRVRAEWVPDDELAPTMESIRYFVPTGEPDLPYEAIAEHL